MSVRFMIKGELESEHQTRVGILYYVVGGSGLGGEKEGVG